MMVPRPNERRELGRLSEAAIAGVPIGVEGCEEVCGVPHRNDTMTQYEMGLNRGVCAGCPGSCGADK